MQFYRPAYYDAFRCTASACSDNCCIGWEIDIDPDTADRYRAFAGPLGEELTRKVDWQAEPPHFINQPNGRCPFLDEENLCRLIRSAGEGALCRICDRHPRFFNWMPGVTEAGLGLCCEEAARLLLESPLPDRFICTPAPAGLPEGEADCGEALAQALASLRQVLFHIAADTAYPFPVRCVMATECARQAQQALESRAEAFRPLMEAWMHPDTRQPYRAFEPDIPPEETARLAALSAALFTLDEPISPAWPGRLAAACGDLEKKRQTDALPEADCQHLFCYFLFRHLPGAALDGDLLGRVQYAALSVRMLRLLAAAEQPTTLSGRVALCKDWSKEVEYAPALTDRLLDAFWEGPLADPDRFDALLLW